MLHDSVEHVLQKQMAGSPLVKNRTQLSKVMPSPRAFSAFYSKNWEESEKEGEQLWPKLKQEESA